jgi:hypothetical protein
MAYKGAKVVFLRDLGSFDCLSRNSPQIHSNVAQMLINNDVNSRSKLAI